MGVHSARQPGRPAGLRGFAFVGRERERAELVGALHARPAVALVQGEAGVGKSRLVGEAVAELRDRGVAVISGACHPLREPLAFGPVIDALKGVGEFLRPHTPIGPAAGALAPLLPDLAPRLPEPPREQPDPGPGGQRQAVLSAARALLTAAAPVVLVVEDVHWADDATRELLFLLASGMPADTALVVTYRGEEQPGPIMGSAFRRPAGTTVVDLELHRLDAASLAAMAQSALGAEADRGLTEALYERSAGLPLIAEEDLITLSGHPGARRQPELLGVPRSVREVLSARLEGLSGPAAAMVDAAAVLAVPAAEELLVDVASLSSEQGADGLLEALERSVLVEQRLDSYGFAHALARRAVYDALPGPVRMRLHRRALDLLRALDPPPLVQLAHHARALGDLPGWLGHAKAAAERAMAVGDFGTAAAQLRQIVDHPGLPTDELGEAALALAEAVRYGTDATATIAAFRRIVTVPGLSPAVRGEIRARLGHILRTHLGGSEGVSELETAAMELEADNPKHAAKTFAVIASMDAGEATADERRAWMDRALTLLERVDDPETATIVHVNRLVMLPTCAEPAIPELIAALPRRTENPRLLFTTVVGLSNAAEIAYCVANDRRVAGWSQEAVSIAEHAQLPALAMYCGSYPLLLAWAAGRWQDFEAALAAYRAGYPDSPLADTGLLGAAEGALLAARGHGARAVERFERILAEDPDSALSLPSAAGLARHHLGREDADGAWQTLAPAVRLLRRREAWPFAFDLLPTAVETALRRSDRPTATALVQEHEAAIAALDCPGAVAEHHLCRGLLLGADEPEQAAAAFEQARDHWRAIGRPYPTALAAERAALAAQQAGNGGTDALTDAIAVFDRLGAVTDGSRCRRHLRELDHGRLSPRGPRDPAGDLSARESQVAGLLAAGASNKDIAAALFVSPRTAEHHVAAVLRKLGTTRKNLQHSPTPGGRTPQEGHTAP